VSNVLTVRYKSIGFLLLKCPVQSTFVLSLVSLLRNISIRLVRWYAGTNVNFRFRVLFEEVLVWFDVKYFVCWKTTEFGSRRKKSKLDPAVFLDVTKHSDQSDKFNRSGSTWKNYNESIDWVHFQITQKQYCW